MWRVGVRIDTVFISWLKSVRFVRNMPLWIKMALVLWVITLVSSLIGYYWISQIVERAYYDEVVDGRLMIAKSTVEDLDHEIDEKIGFWKYYLSYKEVVGWIKETEKEFEVGERSYDLILRKNQEWIQKKQRYEWVDDVLNNRTSMDLVEVENTIEADNHDRFGLAEVFFTNKYGVTIAASRKTSDYYQADEEWWQMAKEKGIYVSEVELDESSNKFGVTVGIKIENHGEFLGVAKMVLDLQKIDQRLVDLVQTRARSASGLGIIGAKLLRFNRELIYSVGEVEYSDEYKKILLGRNGDSGSVVLKTADGRKMLSTYTESTGYHWNPGMKWMLVLEDDLITVLQPMKKTVMVVRSLVGAVMIVVLVMCLILSLFIKKWLQGLEEVVGAVSKGDYARRIVVSSDDEFGRMSAHINDMAAELAKNEKQRKDFIFLAVHQLKTPLTALKWDLELIKGELGNKATKETKDRIEEMGLVVGRLMLVVSDILGVLKFEENAVKGTISRFCVQKELNTLLKSMDNFIKSHGVKIKRKFPQKDLFVDCERDKYLQVLENLISNGVKYGKREGVLVIEVRLEEDTVKVLVVDKGLGIPLEDQQKIFSKFFRASNVLQAKIEGTGLGLYISKRNAESMGAELSFVSEIGKGTVFEFSVPIKK